MARGLLQQVTWRSMTLVVFESLLIVGAIGGAVYARFGADSLRLIATEGILLKALVVAFVCQLCLYYCELYEDPGIVDRTELLVRIAQALGATSLILAVLYFLFPAIILGRGVVAIAAGIVAVSIIMWRMAFLWLTTQVGPRERLLLVGTSAAAVALARELHQRPDFGLKIVGFIDPDKARVGTPVFNPGVIGTVEDIPRIVREHSIDKVVVSLVDARGRLPMDKLLDMRLAGVQFDHLASVYEQYTGKIAIENLRPSWLIFSSGFRKSAWRQAVKRMLDVVLSLIGLVLATPIVIGLAIAVKLTSRGTAIYHHERVGLQGKYFTVYKLRTMQQDAEASTGAVWAQPGDTRVTPLGGFMRRARLDELPQLWNVLRGDMSLVGPRPERPEFVDALAKQIPFYGQRHVVKPGLTGWAQVRYTYGANVEDAMQKLQYDLFYIKNFSIHLDLVIILETIKTVVLRRGA
jgi:sugar transferase (PEP-CTERM system associated)